MNEEELNTLFREINKKSSWGKHEIKILFMSRLLMAEKIVITEEALDSLFDDINKETWWNTTELKILLLRALIRNKRASI